MARSHLPGLSLLGLFGALLMLGPELILGNPEALSDVPLTDPEVQKVFIFAVEKYNQVLRGVNYFKQLRLMEARAEIHLDSRDYYQLRVEFVRTACRKKAGRVMNYERIQKCQPHPRTPETRKCYFGITPRILLKESVFTTIACTVCQPT